MLNLNGSIKLFVNQKKDADGVYFTTSISHKQQDGTYKHQSMFVRFAKNEDQDKAKASCKLNTVYDVDVKKGWIDFALTEGADKKPVVTWYLCILEASFTGAKEIEQKLPF